MIKKYLKATLLFLFSGLLIITYSTPKASEHKDFFRQILEQKKLFLHAPDSLPLEFRSTHDRHILGNMRVMILEGRETFRFDTFGNELFWGKTLRLHEAIKGASLGGEGPGLTPSQALALGLKVDVKALPFSFQRDLRRGRVDLEDPVNTVELLRLNAVVGLTGFFDSQENLTAVGVQCALCHSLVDDSLAPGIGHRLDGWANRDLNIGQIIALAPNLQPFVDLLQIVDSSIDADTVRAVLNSWGAGKFDAQLFLDGKAFNPERTDPKTGEPASAATMLPSVFGLAGVNLHTWTGWGSVPHWNAFVATLEMQGKGRFFDPRLNNPEQFPIAAAMGFGNLNEHIDPEEDRITSKLPALHFYQLSLPAPKPNQGDFNSAAAERGHALFKVNCNRCHTEPLFTEPGWNMHPPQEIGIDAFQANRSPDKAYRTPPLSGIFVREKGLFIKDENKGQFFHDGRFSTLLEVINHYDNFLSLGLNENEKEDLVEYLKSL
ncbi:hypothetical protein [Nitrosococcus oceani]|uniref:Cytochrome c domain-containing protein n=2 Tax=Nitrosococcus oceani TaxID=1229 RepID=Q3JDQ5_NITOC|nr:hypothetical protein [Nitrosococcus oceani]ABA57041.1 hypothetical protein Noc_0518 [Nitrosococcus oceani ATCC 19707]EDZ65705.1 hypothetical protein NOC27_2385 [Nitrosococcus oceani AFC27]KFI20511.1 hypothetical protein IB75_02715 [Nitrosococcus oceani C-27]KFI23617.1 hypothetical protein HW44_02805 [Nitrosococcus oceani]